MQQPPEFSALKLKGKRAYDLARAGEASSWHRGSCRSTASRWSRMPGLSWSSRSTARRARTSVQLLATWAMHSVVAATCRRSSAAGSVPSRASRRSTRESLPPRRSRGRSGRSLDAVAHLPRVVIDAAGIEAVAHGQSVAAAGIAGRSHPEGKGGACSRWWIPTAAWWRWPSPIPPGNAPAEEGVSLLRRDIPARYNSGAAIVSRTTNGCLLSTWIDGKSRRRFPFSANRAPVVDAIPAAT